MGLNIDQIKLISFIFKILSIFLICYPKRRLSSSLFLLARRSRVEQRSQRPKFPAKWVYTPDFYQNFFCRVINFLKTADGGGSPFPLSFSSMLVRPLCKEPKKNIN